MAKVALVVGASSGLGAEVARALASTGTITYAGARSFAGGREAPPGCTPIALDVTDSVSIDEAIGRILRETGRIDVLVYCAAKIVQGACEELPIDALRDVLETNFIGMARTVQAVLPSMRGRGSGRILLFSSINGLLAIPFTGAYIASKHAIEGFGEALSQEVRGFGIRVTLVEPGDCRSGSDAYRLKAARAMEEGSPYRDAFLAATGKIQHDERHGMQPSRVSKAILRTLRKKRPPARLVIAPILQRAGIWLHDLLPTALFNWMITSMYTKAKVSKE